MGPEWLSDGEEHTATSNQRGILGDSGTCNGTCVGTLSCNTASEERGDSQSDVLGHSGSSVSITAPSDTPSCSSGSEPPVILTPTNTRTAYEESCLSTNDYTGNPARESVSTTPPLFGEGDAGGDEEVWVVSGEEWEEGEGVREGEVGSMEEDGWEREEGEGVREGEVGRMEEDGWEREEGEGVREGEVGRMEEERQERDRDTRESDSQVSTAELRESSSQPLDNITNVFDELLQARIGRKNSCSPLKQPSHECPTEDTPAADTIDLTGIVVCTYMYMYMYIGMLYQEGCAHMYIQYESKKRFQ